MPSPETTTPTRTDLDERYGRTPSSARRRRWLVAGTALAFVVVFVAWLVWAGLGGTAAQFDARDTGHEIVGDSAVDVQWTFTAPPGTAARCALQALNSTFAIVGWKVVDLPASSELTRRFSERVLTTETAVTGLIHTCWLT